MQAHVAFEDAWVEEAEISALAATGATVFRYPGGHLFTDPGLPDFHAASTDLLWSRVLPFLATVPAS